MADLSNELISSIQNIEKLLLKLMDMGSKISKSNNRSSNSSTSIRNNLTPEEEEKHRKKILSIEREINLEADAINLSSQKLNELLNGNDNILSLSKNKMEEIRFIFEKNVELMQTRLRLKKDEYKKILENKEATKDEIKDAKLAVEIAKEKLNNLYEQRDAIDEIVSSSEKLQKSTEDLVSKISGLNMSWEEMSSYKIAKNFANTAKKGGGLGVALAAVGKGVYRAIAPMKILGAAVSYLSSEWQRAIIQSDELNAAFNRNTGATGKYLTEILELRKKNTEYNITIKDSFQAYESLMTKLSGFRDLNSELRSEVASHTALMGKMGVAYDTTSEFIEMNTLALGMSRKESIQIQRQFVKLADSMKMNVDEITNAYNKSLDVLGVYGSKAPEVFAKLAKFADKAGLSVDSLLQVTKQFDTFDSAADSVGKLNAMLGGSYLSNIDMLNATEDERIKKIKESLDLAGIQFDQMGKFQQRYVTQAIGLNNVTEAQKLLSGSMSDLNTKLNEQNLSQAEAEKKAQAYTSASQKLQAVFQQIIILIEPIISLMHSVLNAMTETIQFIKENDKVFYGLAIGITLVTVATKGLGSIWSVTTGLIGSFFNGIGSLIKRLFTFGFASKAASVGSTTMSRSMSAAVGPTLAISAGMIGLGVSVGLVVGSVALLIYAISDLVSEASKAPGTLSEVGAGIGLIAASAIALGFAWPVAVLGLAALSAGLIGLALGLAFIKTDDLQALGGIFQGFSNTLENFSVSAFDDIVDGIKRVANVADKLNIPAMMAIGYTLESAKNSPIVKSGLSRNFEKSVSQGSTVINNSRSNNSNLINKQEIVDMVVKAVVTSNNNSNSKSTNQNNTKMPDIVINIDKREVFRVIGKYIEEKGAIA